MISINRYVLSLLVENKSGVLNKIAGLFSRRGYNIDSLSVGETENPEISRMTITVKSDEQILEQIKKQLNKLVDVIKVAELESGKSVCRQIVLIKVKANLENRSDVMGIVTIFRAKIIDVSNESLIVELTGEEEKTSTFTELLKPYGIIEFVRTGITGLKRGKYLEG